MQTARLFFNGRSQAVRLPKEFRLDGDEVLIKRHGDVILLIPFSKAWSTLREALASFDPNVRIERQQPTHQKRAVLKR